MSEFHNLSYEVGAWLMHLLFGPQTEAQFVCLRSRAKWGNWSCLEEKESRKTKRNLKQEKEKGKKQSERQENKKIKQKKKKEGKEREKESKKESEM